MVSTYMQVSFYEGGDQTTEANFSGNPFSTHHNSHLRIKQLLEEVRIAFPTTLFSSYAIVDGVEIANATTTSVPPIYLHLIFPLISHHYGISRRICPAVKTAYRLLLKTALTVPSTITSP